ncbi:MAG: 2,3-bisphosphoglycerate-independent phosphoglycerate mutase [Chloroflexi bacterium]|nr:2,3-bisphosphoglycerate-independent phosphoglycerate mutase [Chloroflexota bacterium]
MPAGFETISGLAQATPSKIVFLVMDGLGGLPHPDTGRTELESAQAPVLHGLAARSSLGLSTPVAAGITPGSGPGHLALFGYDPAKYLIGRGVLEAVGIDFDLQPADVAARGNFCTLDAEGLISDRRAGRIDSAAAARLCQELDGFSLAGVQCLVRPVKEHRFILVLRGPGLSDALTEMDPQRLGAAPLPVAATRPEAEPAARVATAFVERARALLRDCRPANMVLLRGWSMYPRLPALAEVYRLRAGAIAIYPMYRGLAKLVGMEVLPAGETLDDQLGALERYWGQYNFFFLHYKKTDAAGEDGDFGAKVRAIEEADRRLPRLLALKPDVLVITGDHSTPATLAAHSWHPVPVLLHSRWCRPGDADGFNERACARGDLGRLPATDLMPLALAHALKLTKYGA